MNDLQIDYFMAVATNKSFTKTSEELFVSQPAISRQISSLEKELGAKLFVRNNQKTELTAVGKLYFDLFSRYKADLINTKLEAAELLGKKKGTVRVGSVQYHSADDGEIQGDLCGVQYCYKLLRGQRADFFTPYRFS